MHITSSAGLMCKTPCIYKVRTESHEVYIFCIVPLGISTFGVGGGGPSAVQRIQGQPTLSFGGDRMANLMYFPILRRHDSQCGI